MLWYFQNVFHVDQKLAEFLEVQWFLKDLVHATGQGFVHILVLNVSSYSYNFGLFSIFYFYLVICFSYLLCRFVAIHERHVAIHEDQAILKWVIVGDRFLDLFQSLLTIVSEFTDFLSVRKTKDQQETVDDITIELFIVDDEDGSSVKIHLFVQFREY